MTHFLCSIAPHHFDEDLSQTKMHQNRLHFIKSYFESGNLILVRKRETHSYSKLDRP